MAPYSLKNALNLLWVTLKKKRRGFSMAIKEEQWCAEFTPIAESGAEAFAA